MGKLRHIAIQVPDLEKAAAFYEGVFGLKRLKKVDAPIGNAISLSDGVMNLTLLHFPEGTKGGRNFIGTGGNNCWRVCGLKPRARLRDYDRAKLV
jgi:catechol 2,3-dioxygenase-like lactoylglutathione lyase family enzyme